MNDHPRILIDRRAPASATVTAPGKAFLLYQCVALAVHLFGDANWQLPAALERRLRGRLVTPDFHVVHHSRERIETDSNCGSVLPWWDHLFGAAQVRDGGLPIPGAGAR